MTYPSLRYKPLPPVQRLAVAKWACNSAEADFNESFGHTNYLYYLSGLYLLNYANQLSKDYAAEVTRQRNFDYTKIKKD